MTETEEDIIAALRAGIEERNRAIDSINAQRNAAEQRCAVLEETVAWQTARARAAEKELARFQDRQPEGEPSVPFTGQAVRDIRDFEPEKEKL